eukprot:tig00000733_g3773.t1
MKFGKTLQAFDPEWFPHAIDYKKLKKRLKAILEAQHASRDVTEEERTFQENITKEIDKVSSWIRQQDGELRRRAESLSRLPAETVAQRKQLAKDAGEFACALVRLEQFERINGTALHKILKKHDKKYGAVPLLTTFAALHNIYAPKYGPSLRALSDAHARARGEQAAGGAGGEAAAREATAAVPGPDGEAGLRYWVRPERVSELVSLKLLPAMAAGPEIGGEAGTGFLVSSVYLDSESFDGYHARMRCQGSALRIRWFGGRRPDLVYVERLAFGGPRRLERVALREADVPAFLKGEFKGKPAEGGEAAAALLAEIQKAVAKQKLAPVLRTQSRRLVLEDSRGARVSIDSDVCFIREGRGADPASGEAACAWHRGYVPPDAVPNSDCLRFEYATLDVRGPRPAWVDEVAGADGIVMEVAHFSKALLGTALAYPGRLQALPWYRAVPGGEADGEPLPRGAAKQALKGAGTGPVPTYAGPLLVTPREHPEVHRPAARLPPHHPSKAAAAAAAPAAVAPAPAPARIDEIAVAPPAAVSSARGSDADERTPLLGRPASSASAAAADGSLGAYARRTAEVLSQAVRRGAELGADWWQKGLIMFGAAEKKQRIQVPVKVEPKTFFANERTFMNWLAFSVVLMSLGVALISLKGSGLGRASVYRPEFSSSPVRRASAAGFAFLGASMVSVVYAVGMYHYRTTNIRRKIAANYGDKIGPNFLAAVLIGLAGTNIYLYASQLNPPCADFSSLTGGADFSAVGVHGVPGRPEALLAVGQGLAELRLDSLRTRSFAVPSCVDAAWLAGDAPPGAEALVYLLRQYPPSIVEFDTAAMRALRSFDLPIEPRDVPFWSLSAITYLPAAALNGPAAGRGANPAAGHFLVATSGDGRVYRVDLPLQAAKPGAAASVRGFSVPAPGMADLHGLHWHAGLGRLYILAGSSLMEADPTSLAPSREWPLLFRRFRGMWIDESGENAFLTTDRKGAVTRVPFSPENGPQLCDGLFG